MGEMLVSLVIIHIVLMSMALLVFGFADLRTVIIAVFSLYNLSYPIDALFFNVIVPVLSVDLIQIGGIFTAFVLFFFLGSSISIGRRNSLGKEVYNSQLYSWSQTLFYVSSVFYFAQVFLYWEIAVSDRNALYLDPVLSLSLAKIAVSVYFLSIIVTKSGSVSINIPAGLVFSFYCLSEALIFGDRRIVATCLLSAFVLAHMDRRFIPKIKHLLVLFGLAFASLFIETTRYGGDFFEALAQGASNPALGELGAPWFVAMDLYPAVNVSEITSTSFVDSFKVLVPRFIWPERPLGAAQWFVETYYPKIALEGGGFAFSFSMEVMANLTLFGYIIFAFTFGLFISSISKAKTFYGKINFLSFTFSIIFLPRYDAATVLKSLLTCLILLAPLFLPYGLRFISSKPKVKGY